MGSITCNKCGLIKHHSAFYHGRSDCKDCHNIHTQELYAGRQDESEVEATTEYQKAVRIKDFDTHKKWLVGWTDTHRVTRHGMLEAIYSFDEALEIIKARKVLGDGCRYFPVPLPKFNRRIAKHTAGEGSKKPKI